MSPYLIGSWVPWVYLDINFTIYLLSSGLKVSWLLMLGVYLNYFSGFVLKKQNTKPNKQKAWPRQLIEERDFWPYVSGGIEVHYSRAASQASSRHGWSRRLNVHMFKPKCKKRANWTYSEMFLSLKVCPQWCISSSKTALAQPPPESTNWTKYLDIQALEGYFSSKLS